MPLLLREPPRPRSEHAGPLTDARVWACYAARPPGEGWLTIIINKFDAILTSIAGLRCESDFGHQPPLKTTWMGLGHFLLEIGKCPPSSKNHVNHSTSFGVWL